MNSLVVYGSRSGNTQKVAEAIADELRSRGTVTLVAVDEAPSTIGPEVDLVIVGGPTEGHKMTDAVVAFFDRLAPEALRGRAAAAFDTRLWWPQWMSGSAADGIADRLREAGARLVVPEESFIVSMKPLLQPGELERAAPWAAAVAAAAEASKTVGAAAG